MRAYVAEFLGTALLLIGVVGSGVMAQNLADGNIALALLANAIATGCILYCIIICLGPISGAHFNPVVSLAFFWKGELPAFALAIYIAAQISGGVVGVWLVHVMFELPILQLSSTDRAGLSQYTSEIFATFGLLFVIFGGLFSRPQAVPALVGLYITGAYWFTSSTSFANPAVTIARGLSDTFAGINPVHILGFIICQLIGLALAMVVLPWLFTSATSPKE